MGTADLRDGNIEEGISLLFESLLLGNLSPCLHLSLLKLIRTVICRNPFDPDKPYKFQKNMVSILLLFFSHTAWPEQRTYTLKLINLINIMRESKLEMNKIFYIIQDVLNKRIINSNKMRKNSNETNGFNVINNDGTVKDP